MLFSVLVVGIIVVDLTVLVSLIRGENTEWDGVAWHSGGLIANV